MYENDGLGETKCGSKSIAGSTSVNLRSSGDVVYDCYAYFYY